MDKLYHALLTPCDLSMTTLEECAIRMNPSRTYELRVSNQLHPFAIMLVKRMGAFTQDHPFAPQINVRASNELRPTEWYVVGMDTGESWGSPGVS